MRQRKELTELKEGEYYVVPDKMDEDGCPIYEPDYILEGVDISPAVLVILFCLIIILIAIRT